VELTPGGGNVELTLQAENPGGTLLQESFKRVAASPVGENADARATRLATERKRLQRAREKLAAQLQHRQSALSFALADFDVTVGVNQDADVDELVVSLERLNPLMETANERKYNEKLEAAKQACALEMATITDSCLRFEMCTICITLRSGLSTGWDPSPQPTLPSAAAVLMGR